MSKHSSGILVFLLSCLVVCFAKDVFGVVNKVAETTGKLVNAASGIGIVKELIDLVKVDNKHLVSDIHVNEGYKELRCSFVRNEGTVDERIPNIFDKLLASFIKNTEFSWLEPQVSGFMTQYFEALAFQVMTETGTQGSNFTISYNGKDGMLYIIQVRLSKNPKIAYGIDYNEVILVSKFKPADSYIIITDSKSNLFRSSTSQRYVWLPTDVKSDHFKAIFDLNIDVLKALYNIQPSINDKEN